MTPTDKRFHAACAAMQAQIESAPNWARNNCNPGDLKDHIECAVRYADALIAELDRTAVKCEHENTKKDIPAEKCINCGEVFE